MTSGTSGSAGAWLEEDDVELRPGEESVLRAEDPVLAARERAFRDVLGRFATGVTVVTGLSDGSPVGLTCQSFSSVSLDPPLVMFAPARTSRSWPLIQRSGHFCVNILAADQVDVSRTMASRGADKFAGLGWAPSRTTGSPVLAGTLGHVDCLISAVHESGDHYVVVGRVLDLAVTEVEDPLLYFRGAYRTIAADG
jgi:3-hydroxy-9,10-secoandrosta-1,3,5(10)-triene-9,17-dione monooxygenase reductase component